MVLKIISLSTPVRALCKDNLSRYNKDQKKAWLHCPTLTKPDFFLQKQQTVEETDRFAWNCIISNQASSAPNDLPPVIYFHIFSLGFIQGKMSGHLVVKQ